MVYSSGSAVRADVSGPGTWAFMPARLPDGETVVVNAGFVPNTMQDRGQQDRAVAQLITDEPVTLTGYIRFPEAAGMLTPAAKSRQAAVVHPGSSGDGAALGWVAEARSRRSTSTWRRRCRPSGIPKPGPLEVHLKDDHMQYAITWFALAGAVVIAFGVWLRTQRPA